MNEQVKKMLENAEKNVRANEHIHDFEDKLEPPPINFNDTTVDGAIKMIKWVMKSLAQEIICYADSDLDLDIIQYNVRLRTNSLMDTINDMNNLLSIIKDLNEKS